MAKNLLFSVLLLFVSIAVGAQTYCVPQRFEDSVFTTEQISIELDLVYGSNTNLLGEEETLLFNMIQPDQSLDTMPYRPLIFFMHGGGFHGGSKDNSKAEFWGLEFAKLGYVFASVDYRVGWDIAEDCTVDTVNYMLAVYRAQQDIRSALRFVKSRAEEYRIDTSMVFLFGTSAGAASAVFTAYYNQDDFGEYLSDSLGPLEYASNDVTGPSLNVQGLMSRSAGVGNLDKLERNPKPHMMFHGTCDLTVPYYHGPIFYCYNPQAYPEIYGSGDMADKYAEMDVCYWLYTNVYAGHASASQDTVLLYGKQFLKTILCEDCNSRRLVAYANKNQCLDISEKKIDIGEIIPNPTEGPVKIIVNGHEDDVVPLAVYDAAGRKLYEDIRDFIAPSTVFELNLPGLSPGVYILQIGDPNRAASKRFIVY